LIYSPNERVETIIVKYGKNSKITIGSDSDSDLILMDPNISRKHCEIFIDDNENVMIKDCISKFGTLVSDCDRINVANQEMVVQVGRSLFLFSPQMHPNINIYGKNGNSRLRRFEILEKQDETESEREVDDYQ